MNKQWSTRLNRRTTGLFKKAAELSKLEDAQITILVSSQSYCYGYVGHADDDWPELLRLVTGHCDDVATPAHFISLAEYNSERSQSVSSSTKSSITSDNTGPDAFLQRLKTFEAQPRATGPTQALSAAPNAPTPSLVSEQGLAHAQGVSFPLEQAPMPGESRISTPAMTIKELTTTTDAAPHVHTEPVSAGLSPSCGTLTASNDSVKQIMPRVLSAMSDRVQKKDTL